MRQPLPPKRELSVARAISRFFEQESAGGILMLFAGAAAMLLANSPLSAMYAALNHLPVLGLPLEGWVRDVLMVLFFLTVGLELKREMTEGMLSRKGQVLLPLLAALGGMLIPALVYVFFTHSDPALLKGWAVPCATDIAFALCILMLFGRNMPAGVKIFLLAIAVFDDLGAIVIIALFYSSTLYLPALLLALPGVFLLVSLSRRHVAKLPLYILICVYLWFCLHMAGIHTTVAGAMVGFAVPMRDRANSADSPVNRCMHFLHPWVVFGVLPLFAFVSAGVDLRAIALSDFLSSLPLGIALGLFIGKQLGIFITGAAIVGLGWARLPEGMDLRYLYGVSVIAGIGFTMSLFIGVLAFSNAHMQEMAKIGIIAGSLLSALWGVVVLRCFQRY